jgi:hypothetical protein
MPVSWHSANPRELEAEHQAWLLNWPMTVLYGLTRTQRQAQEMILGHNFAVKTRLLSFNRMQSRVIKGHNTTP